MPDEINVKKDLGIIVIRSFGLVTRDDIDSSVKDIQKIFEETGINKILVDATQQKKMPSIIEIVQLFSELSRDLRLALLANLLRATSNELELVRNVAISHGVSVRLFDDRDEALQWLKD